MKKNLLILCALLLTSIGANAQSVVHECVAEVDHWTIAGNTNGVFHYDDWAIEADASGMVVPILEYWVWSGEGNLSAATISHETLTDLTEGYYSVSLDIRIFSEAGNEIGEGTTFAANDASVDVVATGTADVYGTETEVYGKYYLLAQVTTDGTLDISLDIPEGVTYNWIAFKNLEVVYVGEEEPDHFCSADFSHWTQTYTATGTNGEYARNTWSVEADASGMTTPFLQTWVGSDVLSDQTIDHDQLTGLTNGWYSVTVDARIMSESSGALTGTATFTANKDYISIISDGSDGSYNGEAEEYGTYTVECYVDEAGTLDIGFTIANANFNWLAWKNLSVVYLGETVDYHVGEATASTTYVSAGQTVTLTFADCTKGDEEATLGVSSSASVTFGETSVTLKPKGTITFTFEVPTTVEAGNTYTLTIPENTIVWTLGNETQAGNSQQTITFTVLATTTITEGDYLVVNNATGLYLGGCGAWGTQAVLLNKPQYYGFALQEGGAYTMDSYQYFSGTRHYLGTNLYNDAETVCNWTLLEVDGGYAIYSEDAGGYLTGYGTINTAVSVGNTVTDNSVWSLVSKEDVIASMAEATEDNPVDVTALINFPGFNVNCNSTYANPNPWTVSTGSINFGAAAGSYGLAAEGYSTTFDVNQTITLPYAGTYELSAHGFCRTTADGSVMYADDQTSAFPVLTTSISSLAGAWEAFLDGEYALEPITITTTQDNETVTIGFKNTSQSDWDIFGELELLYYGVAEETVEWEMTTANWGTLILPFAVAADDVPADLTIYTCDGTSTSTDSDGNEITTVTVTAVEDGITANTPYLVKGNVEKDTEYTFSGTPVEATDALTEGLLTGTFEDMDYSALVTAAGSNTVYLLQNHTGEGEDGVAFYPVVETESADATLTPYHCYLTLSSASGVRAYIGFPGSGEATAIKAVESDVIADDAIYDLSGRKVSKAVKGVYIQNGKKVLVK